MTGASYPYPAERRIRKRRDFQSCYDQGGKYYTAHFVLFFRISEDGNRRFGMAVSRKVGNAVTRNRIKRLLREFFRLRGHIAPAADIVAIARKSAGALGYHDVCVELEPALFHFAEKHAGRR